MMVDLFASMITKITPTAAQRGAILAMLKDDLARCPLGEPLDPKDASQWSIDVLVLSSMADAIPQDLAHGIPPPLARGTPGDHPGELTGATSLGGLVASRLDRAISAGGKMALLVPHAYALPREVESLQKEFGGNVVALGTNVFVRFESGRSTAETIRGALANMICGFSVAWLFADAGAPLEPVLALVSIFDADGFAIAASPEFEHRFVFP